MSAFCDIALALGLTLGGTCQPAAVAPDPMPADDPTAWSYKEPAPAPKPVEVKPKPAPNFPPIIIKKVVREAAPPPPPAPKKEPPAKKVEKPKGPSAVELAIRAAYQSRAGGLTAWPEVVTPASVTTSAGKANGKAKASAPRFMPGPLDLASVVRKEGDQEYEAEKAVSSMPIDNSRIVAADRIITGVLENGINTQLDGTTGAPLVIQVSRDVFGYHGRNVLVPKGSRLICQYQSPEKIGDSRAAVRCGRILLGESRAEIFNIVTSATDAQGYLGVSGDVDTRFTERFGTALILAGISAAVRAATATSSGLESLSDKSDALTTGGEELSQNLGNIAASALEQTINLAPILKIAQGTRVQLRPSKDWYIAKVE